MKIVQENTGRKETEFDPENVNRKQQGKFLLEKVIQKQPHRSEKQICAAVSQILWN